MCATVVPVQVLTEVVSYLHNLDVCSPARVWSLLPRGEGGGEEYYGQTEKIGRFAIAITASL